MKATFFLLALLAICHAAPFKISLINDTYILQWTIEQQIIDVSVSVDGTSWVGLGWHQFNSKDQKMFNVDFVVAIFDGSSPNIVTDSKSNNLFNNGETVPYFDTDFNINGVDNILSFSGNQDGDTTVFSFKRLLDTKDTKGDWPLTGNGLYHIVYAHGYSNTFDYHGQGPSQRGHWMVNWVTGENGPCLAC